MSAVDEKMAPEWAYNRVHDLIDAKWGEGWCGKTVPRGAADVFATYIAYHEEAPADPLVSAFEEIHGHQLSEGEDWAHSAAERLRMALAKRGLTIAEVKK